MSDIPEFKITVTVAGKTQEFMLGTLPLQYVLGSIPDIPCYAGLFSAAAHHPAAAVRNAVAGQDNLPGDAVLSLATDPSANVRARVVNSSIFRRAASEAMLLKLIAGDPEVAEAIAGNVEMFENADAGTLCAAIAAHPDPSVRLALASNHGTPVKWLKKLREDGARDVADCAQNMLASRSR